MRLPQDENCMVCLLPRQVPVSSANHIVKHAGNQQNKCIWEHEMVFQNLYLCISVATQTNTIVL